MAVKAPGFGDRRKAMLQDIAILTGGQVITEELGLRAQGRHRRHAGSPPVRSRWTRTTPSSSRALAIPHEIKARVASIRTQIEETTSDYDREKLQERLAKLAGGVAVINVGAATEVEMKEAQAAHRGRAGRDPRRR